MDQELVTQEVVLAAVDWEEDTVVVDLLVDTQEANLVAEDYQVDTVEVSLEVE